MTLAIEPIRVTGLRELQAALKAIDGEAQKQIRVVLNEAADLVVSGAQHEAPVKTGAYRKTIKAASGQREAKVKSGSAKVAYAAWLDYGGKVGRNNSASRPFVKSGRYIYPAYYANRAQILGLINAGMARLIADAGLDADE